MNKICIKCEKERSINDFYLAHKTVDGVQTHQKHCKFCHLVITSNNNKKYIPNKKDTKLPINKRVLTESEILERRKKGVEYQLNRRKNDILFRLQHNISVGFRDALKNNSKKGRAIDYIGCSIVELKSYIELKFQPGMTWDNYGAWHIDHIIPKIKFDPLDSNQLKKCWHFTNLQPLWAIDNLKKNAKTT